MKKILTDNLYAFVPCPPGQTCPPPAQTLPGSAPGNPIQAIFGQINPPEALQKFIGNDPTGEQGISKLLSNMIALFYTIAAIVLIFMLLWGAFDWITSEGNKEKIESARNKIINAIIGIMLFAVAFAVIKILGQFTGFTFFTGPKP